MTSNRKGIIVIHGTMGSVLKKDGKKIWPIVNGSLFHYENNLLPLDNGVEPSHLLITYKKLYSSLKRAFDNVEEFIYDWRLNNLEHVSLLKSKISSMDVDEITIVAHSMGGIISKLCINSYPDDSDIKKVKRLITLGTPWKGSMESVKTLLYGSRVPQKYLTFINKETSKRVSSQFPSVYQLLPSDEFLNHLKSVKCVPYHFNDKYFDDFESFFENTLQEEFSRYHNYNHTFDEYYNLLNSSLPDDIELHEIIGTGKPTIRMICENTRNEPYVHYDEGDGTVPLFSAFSNLDDNPNYHPYFVNKCSHVSLSSNTNVMSLVKNIINNLDFVPNNQIFNKLESDHYKPFNGYISKIACPVEISIKDKDGNIIYGNIETIDEEEIRQLLQVNYEVENIGTTTYVIFDDEDDTKIQNFKGLVIDAYDQGLTSIGLDKYENGKVTSKKAFKTFEINPHLQAELILEEEAENSSLILKNEENIEDTLHLNNLLVEDSEVISPTTTLNLSGETLRKVESQDVYFGKNIISLNIQDIEAGTFSPKQTYVIINGKEYIVDNGSIELNKNHLEHGKNHIEYFTIDEYDYTETKRNITLYYFYQVISKVELLFKDKLYFVHLSEDQTYDKIATSHNLKQAGYPIYNFHPTDGVTGYQVVYEDIDRALEIKYVDIFNEEININLSIDEKLIKKVIKGSATITDVQELTDKLNLNEPNYQFHINKPGNHKLLNDHNLNRSHSMEIFDDNVEIKLVKNVELDVSFETLSEYINVRSEMDEYNFIFKVLDIDQQPVQNLELVGEVTFTINDPTEIKRFKERFVIEFVESSDSYKLVIKLKTIQDLLNNYWNPNDKILSIARLEILNQRNETTIRSLEIKIAQ